MALIHTSSRNQVIAVPIKSIKNSTVTVNKQIQTTSSSLTISNTNNSTITTSSKNIPSTIKTVDGLKTLPSNLRISTKLNSNVIPNMSNLDKEMKSKISTSIDLPIQVITAAKSNLNLDNEDLEETKKSFETNSSNSDSKPEKNICKNNTEATKDNNEELNNLDNLSSPESDFDAVDVLNWSNGVGVLPGTSLMFKLNEYNALELLTEKEADDLKKTYLKLNEEKKKLNELLFSDKLKFLTEKNLHSSSDDLYSICATCGTQNLKSKFIRKGRFCSQSCATIQSSQLRSFKKSNLISCIRSGPFNLKRKLSVAKFDKQTLRNRKPSIDKFIYDSNNLDNYKIFNANDEVSDVQSRKNESYGKEKYFSWKKYLYETRSCCAPLKYFKSNQVFNEQLNYFKVGMKLEAIDPHHPSLFCVVSVVETCGFRIFLHFDKYSSLFNFWTNVDSPFIFPVGWCEKTNRKLQPPKNYENFNWDTYLMQEKAKAAPKHCFLWLNKQVSTTVGFKVGMKLEAVDKANSYLVCVATIVDIIDTFLLIHFDGWDDSYDYWTENTSPYIHPINWCKSKGKPLTPPKDYPKSNDKFNWQEYLEEKSAKSVAPQAFRTRSANLFKTGMKLEAVDKRNPRCVRVATISHRNSYSVKIHFDNWDDKYDYWVNDDSPDLHPINWCYQTDHNLEEPPPFDYDPLSYYNRCPIFGCKGISNINNPNLSVHVTAEDCPYSEENMDFELPDRLEEINDFLSVNMDIEDDSNNISNIPSQGSDSMSISTLEKIYFSKNEKSKNSLNNYNLNCFDSDSEKNSRLSSPNSDPNLLPIRQSLYDLKATLNQMEEAPLSWEKNSKYLYTYVNNVNPEEVLEWSCQKVADFVSTLPGCLDFSSKFKQEFIDGEAFLLLTQADLVKILGIKLGPAVKIYNSILVIRRNITLEES